MILIYNFYQREMFSYVLFNNLGYFILKMHLATSECIKPAGTGQSLQLNFTSNNRMKIKFHLCDWGLVGTRWTGIEVFQKLQIFFDFHIQQTLEFRHHTLMVLLNVKLICDTQQCQDNYFRLDSTCLK